MYGWTQNTAARQESRGATTSGATTGTVITSGGSVNTKGSYTNLGTVTGFTYEWLGCMLSNASSSVDFTVDIALKVGANYFVIVEDLRLCSRKGPFEDAAAYWLPVHAPVGAQLAARCQSALASKTCQIVLTGHSCGLFGAPGYSRCIALYAPASSMGVTIDPGATANTKVRTQLIASTAQRVVGIMGFVGPNTDTAKAAIQNWLFNIDIGAVGAEYSVASDLFMASSVTIDLQFPHHFGPFPCDIPAGSRISVNAQCSVNTPSDRTFDFAAWGFVP